MQKVHIIMRSIDKQQWINNHGVNKPEDVKIVYCGYLQFNDDVDVSKIDLWNLCNWSYWCGNDGRPKECEHLLIDHCNSDMSYMHKDEWYSHGDHKFKNIEECFKIMKHLKQSEYDFIFQSLWPTPPNTIEVTLNTINNYTK